MNPAKRCHAEAMSPDELREICLSRPASVEDFPFPRYPGRSTFKIPERKQRGGGGPADGRAGTQRPVARGGQAGGKIFAISSLDEEPLRVSVKCDPDESERLRSEYAAIVPGYRLNKRHWITVYLDGSVPDDLVESLIMDSHELVRQSIPASRRPA